jgi:hypothetical protein
MYKVFFIDNATSVLDRNSFDTDTDPAFHAEYRTGSRVLMTKNLKKIYCGIFLCIKTTIYLTQGLHKGFPSYRRSLQPSKENIQRFKT